ncbi:MAG: hypothetical protein Q7T87_01930 [Polaromonas sp.]|nr:hypothetical protein [Polaromonas sp.]
MSSLIILPGSGAARYQCLAIPFAERIAWLKIVCASEQVFLAKDWRESLYTGRLVHDGVSQTV